MDDAIIVGKYDDMDIPSQDPSAVIAALNAKIAALQAQLAAVEVPVAPEPVAPAPSAPALAVPDTGPAVQTQDASNE